MWPSGDGTGYSPPNPYSAPPTTSATTLAAAGEQVAAANGTDTATLRPVLRGLIESGRGQGVGQGAGNAVRDGVAEQRGPCGLCYPPGVAVPVCARGQPRQVWGYKPQGTDTATLRRLIEGGNGEGGGQGARDQIRGGVGAKRVRNRLLYPAELRALSATRVCSVPQRAKRWPRSPTLGSQASRIHSRGVTTFEIMQFRTSQHDPGFALFVDDDPAPGA